LSNVVRVAPASATKTASRLAGSAALAFSLTRCALPAGSLGEQCLQLAEQGHDTGRLLEAHHTLLIVSVYGGWAFLGIPSMADTRSGL
jgi:hypothetical protein